MEIKKYGSNNSSDIIEFEKEIGMSLPKDYLDFLTKNDGAQVLDGSFYVKDLDQNILMDIFYGIHQDGRMNIREVNNEFKDDIPSESILIGEDPGGTFILLVNDGESNGIYFYDHSYFFEQSNDDSNTYFVADSFSDFLKLLDS